MRKIHVGVAQITSKAMDPQGNIKKMEKQIKAASSVGVEVLLFAEACVHAYCFYPENLKLAEPIGDPISKTISNFAKQYNMTILAGMLEKSDEGVHNSHIVAKPDGTMLTIRKHIMTPFELDANIIPGPRERAIFEINGVRCAINICADNGIDGVFDELHEKGAELLFLCTAGGGYRKDYITEAEMATAEGRLKYIDNRPRVFLPHALMPSHEFKLAMATANAVGDDGAFMTHQGQCMIVDRNRVMRAQIQGTIVIEHFLDQMAHAVLYF